MDEYDNPIQKEVIKMSKSAQIRDLYKNTNLTVAQIADMIGVRYQFAYNVISQYCTKTGTEVRKARSTSTSAQIRELVEQGLTPGQIAKQLGINYVFAHQVAKKYLAQAAASDMDDEDEDEDIEGIEDNEDEDKDEDEDE